MMNEFEKDIDSCLTTLNDGGVILYPTDTVWGLGCDATNEDAVAKIYSIKQRPDTRAMIILVAEERDILQYVAAPDLSVFDYLATTIKPTTVIYEGPIGLAGNLSGNEQTIAIRICQDPFCRHLLKRFRKPIVSTSANISGESTPGIFSEISEKIKLQADYTVTYRQDDTQRAAPSSVIRWERGMPVIIRP